MIKELSKLFQENNSNPDFRNSCLYKLRKIKIKIECITSIEQIDFIYGNAQDMYDDILDVFET